MRKKRQGLPTFFSYVLLPAALAQWRQDCFGCQGDFFADQLYYDEYLGYLAQAGSTVRLSCSSSAAKLCARISSQVHTFGVSGRRDNFADVAATPFVSTVNYNASHTVITMTNLTDQLSSYYSCYSCSHVTPPELRMIACTGEALSGARCRLSGALQLTVADRPLMASPLCCTRDRSGALLCSFTQSQDGLLPITSTSWNISYTSGTTKSSRAAICADATSACSISLNETVSFVNYTFAVNGQNRLGSSSYTFQVYMDDSVEHLPPVHALRIVALTSKAVAVQWQAYSEEYQDRLTTMLRRYGFQYEVRYWPAGNHTLAQVTTLFSYNVTVSIALAPLATATDLKVQVRSRLGFSTSDCSWSDSNVVEGGTWPLPRLAPFTLPDAFHISPQPGVSGVRNVTFYWQASQDARVHPDGRVDGYVIAWTGSSLIVPSFKRSATVELRNDLSYNISIAASQNGSSQTENLVSPATVIVPSQSAALNLSSCQLSAESLDEATVRVEWSARLPLSRSFVYTVFLHMAASPNPSEEDIRGYVVEGSPALVRLPTNGSLSGYRFGVAVRDRADGYSSGIVWIRCVHGNSTGGFLDSPIVSEEQPTPYDERLLVTYVAVKYEISCKSGVPKAMDVRLYYCAGVRSCQAEAKYVAVDVCQTVTYVAIERDGGGDHMFWLQARFGNALVTSEAVFFKASDAQLDQIYYWMVPAIALLVAGATGLSVVIYRLQRSIRNVPTIAHIPRSNVPTSTQGGSEEEPSSDATSQLYGICTMKQVAAQQVLLHTSESSLRLADGQTIVAHTPSDSTDDAGQELFLVIDSCKKTAGDHVDGYDTWVYPTRDRGSLLSPSGRMNREQSESQPLLQQFPFGSKQPLMAHPQHSGDRLEYVTAICDLQQPVT